MGLLRLLLGKKKVTPEVKNAWNKEVEHMQSLCRKINSTDSVKTFFDSLDDLLESYNRLSVLEKKYDWKHGKYRVDVSVAKSLAKSLKAKPSDEKACVSRAYERMKRDCVKLSTQKAKENKRERFFTELEYYYGRFDKSTIKYIESLK